MSLRFFFDFFSKIFCTKKDLKIKELGDSVDRLTSTIYGKNLELQDKDRWNKQMSEDLNGALSEMARFKIQVNVLKRQAVVSNKALAEAIMIPNIVGELDSAVDYNPMNDIRLNGQHSTVDMIRADLKYSALNKDDWLAILSPIQDEVKKALGRWKVDISDCDNFSVVMSAFVAIAFEDAGASKQGAFAVAWSRSHAYNVFVDTDDEIWVYEPQDGLLKGTLNTAVEPYVSTKVMFLT